MESINCSQNCFICTKKQKFKVNFAKYHGVCNDHQFENQGVNKCRICLSIVPLLLKEEILSNCKFCGQNGEICEKCKQIICQNCKNFKNQCPECFKFNFTSEENIEIPKKIHKELEISDDFQSDLWNTAQNIKTQYQGISKNDNISIDTCPQNYSAENLSSSSVLNKSDFFEDSNNVNPGQFHNPSNYFEFFTHIEIKSSQNSQINSKPYKIIIILASILVLSLMFYYMSLIKEIPQNQDI